MLKQGLRAPTHAPSLFLSHKPLLSGHGASCVPMLSSSSSSARRGRATRRRRQICCSASAEESTPSVVAAAKRPVTVNAVLTVLPTVGGAFAHIGITRGLDDIGDLLGKSLHLELVSAELDSATGLEKKTIAAYAHKANHGVEAAKYEASFSVPPSFGEIGAVFVRNEHHKEMYLSDIVLSSADDSIAAEDDRRSTIVGNAPINH
ncbi:hypothetical protein C4D60_Mb03t11150 [Musa balbisiana]|uniref:PLAT domain-containing protein n=1 Tax=Musa balbisiana TaxID=52838 RepID=A0A4S8J962_MUSBA|nr:hypothetical protein C4D60_Mb03t11150 [Musa balbisiana]